MTRSGLLLTALVFGISFTLPLNAVEPIAGGKGKKDTTSNQVLVQFQPGVPSVAQLASHQAMGATPLTYNAELDFTVVSLPPGLSAEAAVRRYVKNPLVAHAEVDVILHLNLLPNDTYYADPPFDPRVAVGQRDHQRWMWDGLGNDRNLDAEATWEITTGSPDVVVAIIDTGVDLDHPDLAANIWTNPGEIAGNGLDDDGNGFIDDVNGYDFVGLDGNPDPTNDANGFDDDGNFFPDDNVFHGTFVAGLSVGRGNDGAGGLGGSWHSKVMAVRVFPDDGGASLSVIINAITYAADMGADVLNYSFGTSVRSSFLQQAVKYAHSQGAVQVAAAGNGNSSNREYPAGYSNVISVGASDHGSEFVTNLTGAPTDIDGRAEFSQYGTRAVDVVAPGRLVFSSLLPLVGRPNENLLYIGIPEGSGVWALASGTSFSSPIVAGLAALIISRDIELDGVRDLSNDDVENHIQTYTVDLPDDPDDSPNAGADWDGNGRVSFRLALEALGGPLDAFPMVTITDPQDGSCAASGTQVTLTATADDTEDGDLSATVSWSSDLAGFLGVGASLDLFLADGTHQITASVTDSANHSRSDQITILVGPSPPLADAGPDIGALDMDGDGVESVALDGTHSSDPCGNALVSYEWYEGGSLIATGPTPSVILPLGVHDISLVVSDDENMQASDDVSVLVDEPVLLPSSVQVDCISYDTRGRNLYLTISVVDNLGNPIGNAAVGVVLVLDDVPFATGEGTTSAAGEVSFRLSRAPNGCYQTVVAAVITEDNIFFDGFTPFNIFCMGTDPSPVEFCR